MLACDRCKKLDRDTVTHDGLPAVVFVKEITVVKRPRGGESEKSFRLDLCQWCRGEIDDFFAAFLGRGPALKRDAASLGETMAKMLAALKVPANVAILPGTTDAAELQAVELPRCESERASAYRRERCVLPAGHEGQHHGAAEDHW
jgi:hypothetical protein